MTLKYCFAFALGLLLMQGAVAQDTAVIRELSSLDHSYLESQLETVNTIAGLNLGRRVQGNQSDLSLLQSLVDGNYISRKNTQDLQALGVVMGNLLAKELNLSWRVYIDGLGRSRALCQGNSEPCLFPMTMLSRRIEVGIKPNVREIYNKAKAIIEDYRHSTKTDW